MTDSGTQPANSLKVAILGGGLSGLSTAWHLNRLGIGCTVFEASGGVGGVIGSAKSGGWLHESGPNTLLAESPETASIITAAGLGTRRIEAAPEARNRYIVKGGRLMPLPMSPMSLVATGLFSWRAKLSVAAEILRPRGAPHGDESVARFVTRRLGREVLDYAVDPFVSGVYAGDPAKLSVLHAFPRLAALEREHRSVILGSVLRRRGAKGERARIVSFPDGIGELPGALARQLDEPVVLETRVTALVRGDRGWTVESVCRGEARADRFGAVVCTLPAAAAAALAFPGLDDDHPFSGLTEIPHPPVVSVFTGFRRTEVAHPLDGFGVLAPWVENRSILGALFTSTLFAGRAPVDHVAITSFVGGARRPELAGLEDGRIVEGVLGELRELLGIHGRPVFVNVWRHTRAIPQFDLGHGRFESLCAGLEARLPGLFVGGSFRSGVSLSACLLAGKRQATVAAAYLASDAAQGSR